MIYPNLYLNPNFQYVRYFSEEFGPEKPLDNEKNATENVENENVENTEKIEDPLVIELQGKIEELEGEVLNININR